MGFPFTTKKKADLSGTDKKYIQQGCCGYLKNFNEEELIYIGAELRLGSLVYNNDKKILYNQITIVHLKRKGAVGRTALYAGLAGLSAGSIGDLASGDDAPVSLPGLPEKKQ